MAPARRLWNAWPGAYSTPLPSGAAQALPFRPVASTETTRWVSPMSMSVSFASTLIGVGPAPAATLALSATAMGVASEYLPSRKLTNSTFSSVSVPSSPCATASLSRTCTMPPELVTT